MLTWTRPLFSPNGSAVEIHRQHASAIPQKRSYLNADFQLCHSYPAILYIPRCLDSSTVRECAQFRAQNRLPALCYFNKKRQNALVRSGLWSTLPINPDSAADAASPLLAFVGDAPRPTRT